MKNKNITRKMLYLLAIAFSTFCLLLMIIGVWIGHEVNRLCQEGKWEYHQTNCVNALIMILDDERQGYRTRNQAIWALGQLGDQRALMTLQKYYTAQIPDREPLDEMISQYELQKAIKLVQGSPNLLALLWRFD